MWKCERTIEIEFNWNTKNIRISFAYTNIQMNGCKETTKKRITEENKKTRKEWNDKSTDATNEIGYPSQVINRFVDVTIHVMCRKNWKFLVICHIARDDDKRHETNGNKRKKQNSSNRFPFDTTAFAGVTPSMDDRWTIRAIFVSPSTDIPTYET